MSNFVIEHLRKKVGAGIGVGVAVVVVILVVMQYYSLNNLQELQFSPRSVGNFDKDTLSLDVEIDACNPTQFPTGFDQIVFELSNLHNNLRDAPEMKEFANMTLHGDILMPNQATTLKGKIFINPETIPVENWWNAYKSFTSLNPDTINLRVTLEATAFGFVPVSVNKDFNYWEFVALLVAPRATEFSCT